MEIDHSQYLEDYFEEIINFPGAPYFRLHYPSVNEEGETIAEGEELLLALHGAPKDLLVISNKRIRKYGITIKKSSTWSWLNFGLGFVPGVGDVMGVADDLISAGKNISSAGKYVIGEKVREEKRRKELNLPRKKDFRKAYWDTNDPQALNLILGYQEHILMMNGFHWKQLFNYKFDNSEEIDTYLSLDPSGITITNGKTKVLHKFKKRDLNSYALLSEATEIFESVDWKVEREGDLIVMKKERPQKAVAPAD